MRILHVIPSLAPRAGGPSNVLGLARALVRQGSEVSVYTTDIDGRGRLLPWQMPPRLDVPTDRALLDEGVSVRYFPVNWPSRWVYSRPLAHEIARTIGTFDLVHIHSLYLFPGFVAAYHARRSGIPYIMRPHGTLDAWHRRQRRGRKAVYSRLIENRSLRGAAAMHYTSVAELDQAREAGVLTPGFVIGMGVDLRELTALPERGEFRAAHPTLADRRLVVFHGRITEKKGLDLLVPAAARAMAADPRVHLVLAGPDDDGHGDTIRRLIRRNRIEDRVTWLGLITGRAKLALLRDADAWALPSYDENFGIAAVEAMATGLPILITTRVGIHEAVDRAEAGLVVEPTLEAVAAGLSRLLTDAPLRDRLGRNARELAAAEFSWDGAATRLSEHYRALVKV